MAGSTLRAVRSEARAISVPALALAAGDPSGNAILALDLGQTTGWAVRNADGAIASGTVEFKPGRFEGGGMVYLRFRAWLQEVDETAGGDRRRLLRGGALPSRCHGGACVWRLPRPSDRVGRDEQDPVPRRAGRDDQAARHRQGQRRQGGSHRRGPARSASARPMTTRPTRSPCSTGRSGTEAGDERAGAPRACRRPGQPATA